MLKLGPIFLSLLASMASYAHAAPDPFQSEKNAFQPGKIVSVTCKANASQSYALYVPLKGNKDALPIIYCFDPHGDGTLPLKKYKTLAETYGFLLVGSNNSKNGNDWPTTENIWRSISEDTKGRLKINGARIYTCGFSGGAKVASYIALQHAGIEGVIAGGAGLPDGVQAGSFSFSFTTVGGEGDMNLTDLIAINAGLDRTRTRHRIIIFDGKHEWAPETTMNIAFMGLQLDAMRAGLIPKDNAFIDRCVARSKARFDMYTKANQLIRAAQECKLAVSLFDELSGEISWFQQKATALDHDSQYQQQRQVQQVLLGREQDRKAEFMQHFQQDDNRYWVSTIDDLKAKATARTAEGAMNQRLLAYLSLAFYSLSNHMINSNENLAARHFVELYKMADPTNSEAWYLSAVLNARAHDVHATESDLLKAVEDGFRDKPRLLQQPEFKNQPTPINFYKIQSKMQPR